MFTVRLSDFNGEERGEKEDEEKRNESKTGQFSTLFCIHRPLLLYRFWETTTILCRKQSGVRESGQDESYMTVDLLQ